MRSKHAPTASTLLAFAASLALAAPAHAYMVAGWDFSQYLGDGLLTIDGENPATTLPANYSNLDPTFNAGAESAAFGTMYINGQFGSSEVDAFDPEIEFVPTAGFADPPWIASNLDAPIRGGGTIPFDTFTVLQAEGQLFANDLAMIAKRPVSVVFEADLTSLAETEGEWNLTFGGRTFSGTSVVEIEFSTDGSDYEKVRDVTIDAQDKPYAVNLPDVETATAFVRFHFAPAGADQPTIDNVAISVPEPAAALQLLAAVAGLYACTRRRG